MRAAWWWIDRWRQSTAYMDMNLKEQGAYRNLLDEVVLREDGIIPDASVARASGDAMAWEEVGPQVLKWMKRVPGGWTNETAMEVKAKSEELSKRQSEKAKKRWGSSGTGSAAAYAPAKPETMPQDQDPYPSQDKYPSQKQRKRISGKSTDDRPETRAVVDDYNATTGRRVGYPGNVELAAKAFEAGHTPESIHRVFVAVRDKSTPAAKWWAEEHKGLDWLMRTTYRRPSDGQTMQGGLVKIPNELDEMDRSEREAATRLRRSMIAHGRPVDPPATPEELSSVRGDA